MFKKAFLTGCLLAAVGAVPLRADVGLVLNSSLDDGSSWVTGAGHAAIYLSRICSDSPTQPRMCREGESGSILSNYADFKEDRPYEWNLVPVEVFLYGVERPEDRSLVGTRELRTALQARYLQGRLAPLCTSVLCRNDPDANWRLMVGATYIRTVHIFKVTTTVQQDAAFLAWLQSRPNVNVYDGFSNNCADFARRVLNFYLPRHVHANRLNDFGMTSPKALARSLTRYAAARPELHLSVARYAQLPSDLPRSEVPRIGTETTVTTAKFVAPLAYVQPWTLAIFGATYLATGRFSVRDAVRKFPEDAQLAALHRDNPMPNPVAKNENRDAEIRESMARDFPVELAAAKDLNAIRGPEDLKLEFRDLETASLRVDDEGRSVARLRGALLPLTAATLPQAGGTAEAYTLELARMNYLLHAGKDDREPVNTLQQDWKRLVALRHTLEQDHDRSSTMLADGGN